MPLLKTETPRQCFELDADGVPVNAIVATGGAMFIGVLGAFVLPGTIYLFLVSSGGFALLFTYLIILLTHYVWLRRRGCPVSPTVDDTFACKRD